MNQRIEQLRNALTERKLDAMLVLEPHNRRYISGFTGTEGAALITAKDALFFADFRYVEQAEEQCAGFQVVRLQTRTDFDAALEQNLAALRVNGLGFEQNYVTYGDYERYLRMESRVEGLTLIPTSGVIESIRLIKSESEVELIQKAADISDAAFMHILGFLRPGLSEIEVAAELEAYMRQQGASGPSFETIVASGWRSSLPHGVATDKVLESGDFVKMDFGAVYKGYVSDITRTVVLGSPTEKQKEIYQIVLEAQLLALDKIQAGMTGKSLDDVARSYIAGKGYGDAFGHSLGHGIGLEIHEGPAVSKTSTDILQPGMIVTVEPGIYLSKWGGVRIEDDVLLLKDGKRIFNHAPKDELISI